MNWLQKIAVQVSTDKILEHVYSAIKYMLPGEWDIIEDRGPLMPTFKFQKYQAVNFLGKNIYVPNDHYLVKVFLFVKRNLLGLDRTKMDEETWQAQQMKETVPLNTFDSSTGHALVYFHVTVWGNSPGRSWENKYHQSWSYRDLYEIGTTRPIPENAGWLEFAPEAETPLNTPGEVAEWIKEVIEKAHKDFDEEGDEGNDEPITPPDTPHGVKSPSKVPSLV